MSERNDPTEEDGAPPTEATKREGHAATRPGAKARARLERGTVVGRYVVVGVVGEGGMGVVYEAYDPELDRKVAIKLLQASLDAAGGDQALLQREAQAMARLSHPNVLAVYDVGTLPGHGVFIAMELVVGSTLREWLEAEPRPWRDVVRVMHAAGTGLAAAHAAGLVHRDFKPDNVLVGTDGRVRVMDFGLARLRVDGEVGTRASRDSDLSIETRSPLSESMTQVGCVVGTPAYMAPEIYEGHPADAHTDQFAFGVTLYEALYRTRPFDKKALKSPRDAALAPKPPPPEVSVPAKLQRVVMRAIAIARDARYPAMDALLADLAVDPHASRRRTAIALVAGLAVAGTIGGAYAITGSHDQVCKGADRRLAGTWDADTKRAIHQAFDATKLPYAGHAWSAVEKVIDGYTAEWVGTQVESCSATRIHGDQSEDVMSLRQDCLDQRLGELHAFTELLTKADAALVDKAEGAAEKLEPLAPCSNIAALRAPTQPSPEMKVKLGPVFVELAAAKAALISGNVGGGINHATKAADAATQLGFDPVAAEARLVLGLSLAQAGNPQDGVASLSEAAWAGLRGRRDDVAALAALWTAMFSAESLNKLDEARIWLGVGTAAAVRSGGDRVLELRRLEVAGVVAVRSGDLGTAVADHEQALDLAQKLYGPDAIVLAQDELLLGATLTRSGFYVKGVAHYEHALALLESAFGPMHPDLGPVLTGLGIGYAHAGKPAQARATYARALAIREQAFGKDSLVLVPTLNNLADFLRQNGDAAGALVYIERAKVMAKALGTGHPLYQQIATTYGETLFALGRVDEASAWLDGVIAIEAKAQSPILPTTLTSRAEISLAQERWQEAADLCDRAIAAYEATGGKDEPELWKPLTGLGRAKLGLGTPDEARPVLERALAIATKLQTSEADLKDLRDALARAK